MTEVQAALKRAIKDLFGLDVEPELTRPDEQFGDYATNIAMQLAKQIGKPPREIAEALTARLRESGTAQIKDVAVAGPGFINITLSDAALLELAQTAPVTKPDTYKDQIVVAEYSDPNPFKVLHAGHLYTSVVGYAIGSLLEAAGGKVHRVNFGGDVGLHVGRTMWAILQELGGEHPEKLQYVPESERSDWMAQCYVKGTSAFDENAQAKAQILELNKRVYQLHEQNDHDSPFAQIYWTCRQWSYDAFEAFYARIGTPFEKYYPESACAEPGLKAVREHLQKGVFEQSDGAVVFKGEPYGLHTRVFINAQGIPTYETKDVGLIMLKKQDYNFDSSIMITGNEQEQYMAVVLKAIEQFAPDLVSATSHLTHGMVKLKGGVKMSSRRGNILRADDVLSTAADAYKKTHGSDDEQAALGAVKYAFIKHRIGPDIIYDPEESVSLEGNSGPYLQYAHARARSILAKADSRQPTADSPAFQAGERSLARKVSEYPEVIQKAVGELMPHHIATYLYELAQIFNSFYEHNRVVGDPREAERLKLVQLYADVLKDGLNLLGIAAPDRM